MRPEAKASGYLEATATTKATADFYGMTNRNNYNSRFPAGMTERRARATASAKANTGVLRFAQDDGL